MSNKEWLSDTYVTEWLSKVGERTQKNYKERIQNGSILSA